jgi:AcrR family transcriptional regulator
MSRGPSAAVATPRRAAALPPDERRSAIVAAALPLLIEHGDRVTTRQIADAAGIAEGTIFRVFADKDAVIAAVVETALDTAPLERDLESIDPRLPLEKALMAAVEILQQRVVEIWRLFSSVGPAHKEARPVVESEALVRLCKRYRDRLRLPPAAAARILRTLTLSTTHPMIAGEPLTPAEIVKFFLHGAAAKTC